MEIKSVEEFANLVKSGYNDWKSLGEIVARDNGNLVIFNYTNAAIYKREWNFVERICRGLIIDKTTGEIVARPFDKFFNLGEIETPDSKLAYAIEKVDGSLGILYRQDGELRISTRGSFDSEQAIRATDMLHYKYKYREIDSLPITNAWTLLFEIVYPENRIVVPYQESALYLIGIRNRFTGKYIPTMDALQFGQELGFSIPEIHIPYSLDQIKEILPKIPYSQEGWVLEFENGTRLKAKGEEYLRVHKLIYNVTPKNVLRAIRENSLDEMISLIPDEFLNEILKLKNYFFSRFEYYSKASQKLFNCAPYSTRKEFAIWTLKNAGNLKSVLFAMYDNKPFSDIIWDIIEKDKEECELFYE